MGILLGLSAALCWGTSDFCAATVARKIGALRAIFYTQIVGLLAIFGLLIFQDGIPTASPRVLLVMLGIGCGQTLAVFLFYRAFEIGKLSVVAPINSGFAVVTAILALLSGERPGGLALGGALLLIVGVVLVTRGQVNTETTQSEINVPPRVAMRGIPEAIGAAFAYGAVFWALDYVVPTLGTVWPLAAMRVVTLLCLGSVMMLGFFMRKKPAPIDSKVDLKKLFWPICAVAATDTMAWLSFNAGTQGASVSIVTALGSLYSAVTVFYGCVFWRERLRGFQWLGVGLIFFGVLLVGV